MNQRIRGTGVATAFLVLLAACGASPHEVKDVRGARFELSDREVTVADRFEQQDPTTADAQTRCGYWKRRSYDVGTRYSDRAMLRQWTSAKESEACAAPPSSPPPESIAATLNDPNHASAPTGDEENCAMMCVSHFLAKNPSQCTACQENYWCAQSCCRKACRGTVASPSPVAPLTPASAVDAQQDASLIDDLIREELSRHPRWEGTASLDSRGSVVHDRCIHAAKTVDDCDGKLIERYLWIHFIPGEIQRCTHPTSDDPHACDGLANWKGDYVIGLSAGSENSDPNSHAHIVAEALQRGADARRVAQFPTMQAAVEADLRAVSKWPRLSGRTMIEHCKHAVFLSYHQEPSVHNAANYCRAEFVVFGGQWLIHFHNDRNEFLARASEAGTAQAIAETLSESGVNITSEEDAEAVRYLVAHNAFVPNSDDLRASPLVLTEFAQAERIYPSLYARHLRDYTDQCLTSNVNATRDACDARSRGELERETADLLAGDILRFWR